MANPWSTGLCDCFTDCNSCCLTYWCPCVAFGRVSEIVDKGTSSCCANGTIYCLLSFVTGWGCLYSCYFRSKMREQYMLKGSSCGDCMVHVFCEICALCQEYRELENRGYDLSLGWHGNLERQNKGVVMAPKVEGDMKR